MTFMNGVQPQNGPPILHWPVWQPKGRDPVPCGRMQSDDWGHWGAAPQQQQVRDSNVHEFVTQRSSPSYAIQVLESFYEYLKRSFGEYHESLY